MTSKEAIENIECFYLTLFKLARPTNRTKLTDGEIEAFDVIKKDLEILEIFKKYVRESRTIGIDDNVVSTIVMIIEQGKYTDEDMRKIRKWLGK